VLTFQNERKKLFYEEKSRVIDTVSNKEVNSDDGKKDDDQNKNETTNKYRMSARARITQIKTSKLIHKVRNKNTTLVTILLKR
jgi:hypothetical protein